jgi:hypothetical protein
LKKHLSTFINGVSRKSKQKKKHKWEKTGVPVFFLLEMIRWGTEEKAEQKRTEERANAVRPYGYDVFSQSVILSKAKNRPASSTRSVQNTISFNIVAQESAPALQMICFGTMWASSPT